jgi:cellulose synthase (UDP-forming)
VWPALLQLFAPMIFVLGSIYVLGSMLPIASRWARFSIFTVVWLIVAWYLQWRLFDTMLPAEGEWYEVTWLWLCFAIELLATADQLILYITLLRTTDRRAEADRHEARIRALPPEQLPSVDVYIPTYNEPIEVLEKTITGALCLDYPNVSIWILDDGRRPWLKTFCETKGVGYLNRPDNAHAKAGNINHALTRTNAEFVVVFDADFVPQRNFLMRTIGFFSDPEIGIVQVPHAFYNYDPMQTNLALRKSLPDEQRFFFDVIMPSRDGWNAAFCCGSNSVTRRAALRSVGDALPTQSITEDMLLTMTLLRQGYVTRYLCERLAFGLAPETVDAFFVQRQRWARGAIQILYLAGGPLGRNLTLMQRLLFLPTHWLSLGLRSMIAIVAPIVFLWTGVSPVFNVTPADVLYYFIPMVLALAGGVWTFAPGQHFPLATQVQGTLLSFKILPTVLVTLLMPFGHPFKVTPKGSTSQTSRYARGIFWMAAGLIGTYRLRRADQHDPRMARRREFGRALGFGFVVRDQRRSSLSGLHDVVALAYAPRRRTLRSRRAGVDRRPERSPVDGSYQQHISFRRGPRWRHRKGACRPRRRSRPCSHHGSGFRRRDRSAASGTFPRHSIRHSAVGRT